MINEDLKKYIDNVLVLKVPPSRDFLRVELLKSGWGENDVDQALHYFDSPDKPPKDERMAGSQSQVEDSNSGLIVPDFITADIIAFESKVNEKTEELKNTSVINHEVPSNFDDKESESISERKGLILSKFKPKSPDNARSVLSQKKEVIDRKKTSAFSNKSGFLENANSKKQPEIKKSRHSRKSLFIKILLVLIIAILCLFSYLKFDDVKSLFTKGPSLKIGEVLDFVQADLGEKDELAYNFKATILVGNSKPEATIRLDNATSSVVSDLPLFSWLGQFLKSKSDLNYSLELSGENHMMKGEFGNQYNFDYELRTKIGNLGNLLTSGSIAKDDNKAFLKLNSKALRFMGSENIVGKWVNLSNEDLWSNHKRFGFPDDFSKEDFSGLINSPIFAKSFASAVIKSGFLEKEIDQPQQISNEGENLYEYRFRFVPEKSNALRVVLLEELGKSDDAKVFVPAVQNSKFGEVFTELLRDGHVVVSLGDGDSVRKISSFFNVVLSSDGKALVPLSVSLNITFFQSDEKVQLIREFISSTEAVLMANNISAGTFKLQKQIENVQTIRAGLSSYNELTSQYPDSLDDLLQNATQILDGAGDADTKLSSTFAGSAFREKPILSELPVDQYGKAFGYQKGENDYKISYEIQIPEYEVTKDDILSLYMVDYVNNEPRLRWLVANGENTANKNNLSDEAIKLSISDLDKDGVPASFEEYIGTSDKSPVSNGTDKDIDRFLARLKRE